MDLGLFLKGFVSGMAISVPVGPVGIFCLRNAIKKGRTHGFFSGIGAATCDAFYAGVICFGLSFISNFLTVHEEILRIISGILFCGIGYVVFVSKTSSKDITAAGSTFFGSFATTFLISLTNPFIIFTFIAIFTILGVGNATRDFTSAIFLILGVFAGSSSWWLVFATKINPGKIKIDFEAPAINIIKKLIGVLIILTGLITIFADLATLNKVAHFITGIFNIKGF